jgi:uncharacterized protein (DUF1499 family)
MNDKVGLILALAGGLFLALILAYAVAALRFGRAGVWAGLFGPPERHPVDFRSLRLRETPNQYLVCPPNHCAAKPHQASPAFDLSAEELRDAWLRMIERRPRVSLLTRDAAGLQYDFEARTPVLLFPDTVTVRFIPLESGKSTLAIYSRSHYGHSDFGVNRGRVRRWLRELAAG